MGNCITLKWYRGPDETAWRAVNVPGAIGSPPLLYVQARLVLQACKASSVGLGPEKSACHACGHAALSLRQQVSRALWLVRAPRQRVNRAHYAIWGRIWALVEREYCVTICERRHAWLWHPCSMSLTRLFITGPCVSLEFSLHRLQIKAHIHLLCVIQFSSLIVFARTIYSAKCCTYSSAPTNLSTFRWPFRKINGIYKWPSPKR